MKKINKIILFFLVLCLIASSTKLVFAEEVQISVVEKPNVDILLTTGKFDINLDNFKNDIKTSLESDGIDTSNINFQVIETVTNSFDQNAYSAQTIYDTWTMYPNPNSTIVRGDYIVNDDGVGVGKASHWGPNQVFLYKDLVDADTLTFEADLLNHNCCAPSGFVVNYNEQTDVGYVFLVGDASGYWNGQPYQTYMRDTILVRVDNFKYTFNRLLPANSYGSFIPYATNKIGKYTLLRNISTGSITHYHAAGYVSGDGTSSTWSSSWHHIKVTIDKDGKSSYYVDDKLAFDYDFGKDNHSGQVGLMFQCTAWFKNVSIQSSKTVSREFKDVLTEPTWRSDAIHTIVNVDSSVNESISSPEVLTRTLADNIHFIQWGNESNKSSSEQFITKNDNKGMFVNGTTDEEYNNAIRQTALYIESLMQKNTETQYIVTEKDVELNVVPESFKTNAVNVEYPNGRWIVHHNYTYFDNNLGQSMQTEMYTPDLLLDFDKPGAYDICFDDNLIKTVYAHREPVADFSVKLQSNNLSFDSNSYDEDSNVDKGFGKGIEKETWSYKEPEDSTWTTGTPTKLDNNVYIIKLEVEDMQGATAYTTKYVGTGNPVSYFLADKSQFNKYYNVNLTDASYDPEGYDITAWEWTLKSGKDVVATYIDKEPVIDFVTLGAGEYILSLKVKNSQNTWSENYTRGFTVTEDATPPSVTIDPTYCDWKDSQDIHIQIEDNESGLDKWRYCYTQSQDAPTESDWGEWFTSTDTTLTFDTDGEYYLHFEAYDVAGNKLERTVGAYKITHPYTNKVTHRFGVVDKEEFKTYDWGKWYSPTDEFKLNIKGFELKNNFNASYPVAGTTHSVGDRIKQPSSSVEFDFFYEPIEYNITYDYVIDCNKVNNPDAYNVLNGFKLLEPTSDEHGFLGWYLDGVKVDGINNYSNNFGTFDAFVSDINNRLVGDITLIAKWDTTPPTISVSPEKCEPMQTQDIQVSFNDTETGFNKWRYCFTDSADTINNWSDWKITNNDAITIDKDGYHYLHIEAYDKGNNKATIVTGIYQIKHPYINKITQHFGVIDKTEFKTVDYDVLYNPVDGFESNVNGFKIKDKFNSNYPVANTAYNVGDKLKQPSGSVEYDIFYEPINYNVVYDYVIDCSPVKNPDTYNVLEGFKLNNPNKDGYEFMGWYLDGVKVNDINYGKINNFDDFESFKNEMDNRTSGNITLKALWYQTDVNYTCNVTAEIASIYKVTIPKTIVSKGQKDTSIEYNVTVDGDIAGREIINVVPDSSVVLSTKNKNNVIGIITQSKVKWAYADLGTTTQGRLDVTGLSAGKWSGSMNFNISIENFEDNKSSEESVIYKSFDLPILN